MSENRDVVINVLKILSENKKILKYFHFPIENKSVPKTNIFTRRNNKPTKTNLDLFFLGPINQQYDINKLNIFQERLYHIFTNQYTNGKYGEIINNYLELGNIIIDEENHILNTKQRTQLIILPSTTLALKAYKNRTITRIPVITIDNERKKENLESKVIRLFPQKEVAI